MVTRIERSLELNASAELVLVTLADVAGAAACLPGLAIGAPLGSRTFEASMAVQAGLLVIRYTGTMSVGEVDAQTDAIRFRVEGEAPGGRTLAVAIAVAVKSRSEAASRLTIVNEITLDPGTTLLAGPMIAMSGGILLDGFSRNLKRMLHLGRTLPPSEGL